jgi:hypothetical protein
MPFVPAERQCCGYPRGGAVAQGSHVGAVAFSRTGDPSAGEFSDAVLLRAFGDVPSDLSAL